VQLLRSFSHRLAQRRSGILNSGILSLLLDRNLLSLRFLNRPHPLKLKLIELQVA
jgi:hypothetical protein